MTDLNEMALARDVFEGNLGKIGLMDALNLHKRIETRINGLNAEFVGDGHGSGWYKIDKYDVLKIIEEEFGKLDNI